MHAWEMADPEVPPLLLSLKETHDGGSKWRELIMDISEHLEILGDVKETLACSNLIKALQRLLALPWCNIRMSIYALPGQPMDFETCDHEFIMNFRVFSRFSAVLGRTDRAFHLADRFELVYTATESTSTIINTHIELLFSTWIWLRAMSRQTGSFEPVNSGWVCGGEHGSDTLSLVVDIKEDLEAPEGATWEFSKTDGRLVGKPLVATWHDFGLLDEPDPDRD
jgi:hypothetical protein